MNITRLDLARMRLRLAKAWKQNANVEPGGFFDRSYDRDIREAEEDVRRLEAEERARDEPGQT